MLDRMHADLNVLLAVLRADGEAAHIPLSDS
jgi:hypothetical protein